MEVNILPFVVEALGVNKKIYKDIDKLYQSNKCKFYKAARGHELYNHPIIKEGSLIQEEYCKKVLGILTGAGKDIKVHRELQQIIKKGYHYTWVYLENHINIDLQRFVQAFLKKHNGYLDKHGIPIEYHVVILIFLSMNSEVNVNTDDFYNGFLRQLQARWVHYNDSEYTRISVKKAKAEDKLEIRELKKAIYQEFGAIKNFDDILNGHFDEKKMDSTAFLFDYENLSSIDIFEDISFTQKDIDEILYLYVLYNYDSKQSNNYDFETVKGATIFLITHMYIKYLIKAYKQVKEMYFENNKETMFVELEELEKQLQKTKSQLSIAENNLLESEKKRENLVKENARLKAELEEEQKNREELNSLREFLFSLDRQEEFITEAIDFDILQDYKAIIVGGHEKWQKRMKELLPNFIFIHPDNLNFDTRLLDGVGVVFIYVNYLNHGLYYKVMSAIAGKNIKVAYLNQQNEELVLHEIAKYIKTKGGLS